MRTATTSIPQQTLTGQVPFETTTEFIFADGVYPYPDPIDRWVVIVDGDEVAWCADQGRGFDIYNDIVRIEAEHADHCPDDIPWQGEPQYGDDELGLEARG